MAKYTVNPVKATCMKYVGQENGIQGLNDTCFNICADFSGTYNTFAMDPQCTQACEDFIEKKRWEIFGVGRCDHQVPYRPVAWKQVPNYIPMLLNKGMNVEQARNTCKQMCSEKVPMLSAECQEKCDTNANAVEEYKPTIKSVKPNKPVMKTGNDTTNSDNSSSSNTLQIIGFVLFILSIVTILAQWTRTK